MAFKKVQSLNFIPGIGTISESQNDQLKVRRTFLPTSPPFWLSYTHSHPQFRMGYQGNHMSSQEKSQHRTANIKITLRRERRKKKWEASRMLIAKIYGTNTALTNISTAYRSNQHLRPPIVPHLRTGTPPPHCLSDLSRRTAYPGIYRSSRSLLSPPLPSPPIHNPPLPRYIPTKRTRTSSYLRSGTQSPSNSLSRHLSKSGIYQSQDPMSPTEVRPTAVS